MSLFCRLLYDNDDDDDDEYITTIGVTRSILHMYQPKEISTKNYNAIKKVTQHTFCTMSNSCVRFEAGRWLEGGG
jgi:hypothetical protein